MRELLDAESVDRGLRRVAGEILERHQVADRLVLIGVRRGGVPLARIICRWIEQLEGYQVAFGTVDITLYRDDAATALANPRIGPSDIAHNLDGKEVILVDDVVQTGRTIRAALDALLDFGRPRTIELAALVDRGGRELPIQPDYLVRALSVAPSERVDVVCPREGQHAVYARPFTASTLFPPLDQTTA